MILINFISDFCLNRFYKEILDCLNHNLNHSLINNIYIICNNTKIIVPKNDKVILLQENTKSESFILDKVVELNPNQIFIYANPLIKFDSTLRLVRNPREDFYNLNDQAFIFTTKSKRINSEICEFTGIKKQNQITFKVEQVWSDEIRFFTKFNDKNKFVEQQHIQVQENSYLKKSADPEDRKEIIRFLNDSKLNRATNNIDVIIVSVNYNDFLKITLPENLKIFDRITVVTSPEDLICQEICENLGVKCIVTNKMYENNAPFNKGKAINEGILSLQNPDWILLLDADIIVPDKFLQIKKKLVDLEKLYICGRCIIETESEFLDWQINKVEKNIEQAKGYGFFHLFHVSKLDDSLFPESSISASHSDLQFRNKFYRREILNLNVMHLGYTGKNWKGRITDEFQIIEEVFQEVIDSDKKEFSQDKFDINNYFDKIYCINLDKDEDRWNNCKQQFKSFNLNVERFSAIDGDNLEFEPQNLDASKLSRLGLLENKFALGCLLSHKKVVREAKSKGYKRILVFEDDVIISQNFLDRISEIQSLDWRLCYLGASQYVWNVKMVGDFYYCKNTYGSFAYALDESLFDQILEFPENEKSYDNQLITLQRRNYLKCFTFFPNICISDVTSSSIRDSKIMDDHSKIMKWESTQIQDKLKVLLVPDVKDWAFDNIAKSIIKYNPYKEIISYDIFYSRDLYTGKGNINYENYDFIYVFFEGERLIPDSKNIIRGCYSSFWKEDSKFSREFISSYFSKCGAAIFANDYLKNEISKNLPNNHPVKVLPDSSDEELFYPIDGLKNEEFTVIFVGNTKRKVKNFGQIKQICELVGVKLIVCENVRNQDLVKYYNKADVCINFSDSEGGPQTFIESSLCEVPMLIRESNELSKSIPCFTGESKEDFIKILSELKEERSLCKDVGKKARKVCLENFTFKTTSADFGKFVIDLYNSQNQKNISSELNLKSLDLTVFIISFGENPNYNDCLNSINGQNVKFKIKHIKNVAPMSAAFQKMIDECDTKYYIQVDEDMILDKNAVEILYNTLSSAGKNISTVTYMLRDIHLDFDIYGVKIYNHDILKKYPYNLDIISCEVEQINRLKKDGYDILMIKDTIGLHSPKWTNDLIYERYFDLMEKWKKFKYHWMSELPAKLLQIFQNEPSEQNLYALLGAMFSLSSEEPLRNREKNFDIKDEKFMELQRLLSIKNFNHIKNN